MVKPAMTRRRLLCCAAAGFFTASRTFGADDVTKNVPSMVDADGRLRFDFGAELMVLDGGLQPSLLRTASGALVVQSQMPQKPVPTARMHYPFALATVVSRDDGKTWTSIPVPPNENGINLEAGAIQLRSGEIVALDTYITPGERPDEGLGQLYTSNDDWRTLQGPQRCCLRAAGHRFLCLDGRRRPPPQRREATSPHSRNAQWRSPDHHLRHHERRQNALRLSPDDDEVPRHAGTFHQPRASLATGVDGGGESCRGHGGLR